MPAPDAPIAIINGLPINNKAFNDILMQVAGMRVFQNVFDLSLVQKACLDSGIPISGDDFMKRRNDELDKTMTGLGIVGTTTQPMTLEQRTSALAMVLQQQNVTQVEFLLTLDTRVGLRTMSEGKFAVPTDTEIKDAYDSEYGEKRKVHIIAYPDTQSVVAIKAELKTAKTPEDACKDLKLPAPYVWIISKNAVADNVKAIRDVAFDYLKTIGQVSEETLVPTGNGTQKQKVLVILDEITKDRTAENKFDDKMKEDIRKKVYDLKQVNWMNNHLMSLRSRASVDIKDPILAEMFNQAAAIQRANAAAQTQPSGVTGTAPAPVTTAPAATAPALIAPATAPATRLAPALVPGRGN